MDANESVVFERVPVASLPPEWREGRSLGAEVRVIIEPTTAESEELPLTRILEEMQDQRVFSDDPVKRIRALRAEWDRREELHARIRAGDA